MGQFSWLDCKTGEQVLDGVKRDVYVLVPKKFGGDHILETCYDGYGHFGYRDIYALVAEWNRPQLCTGNDDIDRNVGIDIACYNEQNASLKYPIKITHDPNAVYEDCKPSLSDPNQGCPMDDKEKEITEDESPSKPIKHAVISYWVGEYEPAKTWLYDSEKDASEAMKRLYKQSYDCAKEDENFEKAKCFIDETSAKVAWNDGLERWFEISDVQTKEEI